jgi:hypothetical protein
MTHRFRGIRGGIKIQAKTGWRNNMTRLFATAGGITVDKVLDIHRPPEQKHNIVAEDIGRLTSMPKEATDDTVVSERATIEACSSSGKTYIYSSRWPENVKQQLVEYAAICGCKSVDVDPESEAVKTAVKAAVKPTMNKEASATPKSQPQKKTLDIGDVFRLEHKGDTSHLEKAKWEHLTAESKMATPDVVTHKTGSILPIGGGESYEKSPHLRVKPGQNSVTAPDAIGDMLKDKGEDIGTSLRRQKAEREAIRQAGAKASEEALAGKMSKDKDYGAYGNRRVHMTEAMTAQPGIRDGKIMAGAFQKNVEKMPDKTQGEQLRGQAEQRKAGIQRQASASKPEFRVMGSAKHTLSDVFTQPEKWMPKAKEPKT